MTPNTWTADHPRLSEPLVFDHMTKSPRVAQMLAFHVLRNMFPGQWDLPDLDELTVTTSGPEV